MMRMRIDNTKTTGLSPMVMNSIGEGGGGGAELEVRPCGMLVQKRNLVSDRSSPIIRLKIKYDSTYHHINIYSQATFGELKKMLVGPTGLHHQDQKLYFKNKERDSNAFLDLSGVKDKSKLVLIEDPISQERRLLESSKNAKMEKASKRISDISLEVDKLSGQVLALESIASKGGKVDEEDVLHLIELLMNQLLKLDGIVADGDVKLQRKMQVRRVQKYVETLDVLKLKNAISMPNGNGVHKQTQQQQKQSIHSNGQKLPPPTLDLKRKFSVGDGLIQEQPLQLLPQPQLRRSTTETVITMQWETFDSTPAKVPAPSTSTSTSTYATNHSSHQPKFPWDFFD